jgi:tetrahydromethanopterin S-methyltransferase subunit G
MSKMQEVIGKLVVMEDRTARVYEALQRVHSRLDDMHERLNTTLKDSAERTDKLDDEVERKADWEQFGKLDTRVGKLENRVSSMRGWASAIGAMAFLLIGLVEYINHLQMTPLTDVPRMLQQVIDINDAQDKIIADLKSRLQNHEQKEAQNGTDRSTSRQ